MKFSTGFIFLLFPVAAISQNYQGMSEQDMQNMMKHAQEMQTCMQGIDQSKMKSLEQQANKVQAEVESLCASGKRDAAQQKGMAFAREMSGNPDVQAMRKCGEKMRGMLPQIPYLDQAGTDEKSGGHVCD